MDATLASQTLAISSSFALSSYNFTFSHNVIPHLYTLSPSISTPIFADVFRIASATIAPTAAVAIAGYGYLSYSSHETYKCQLYGSAAILTFATLPLTAIVMKPGINRLIEIRKNSGLQAQVGVGKEVTALFKTWVGQNYFRASMHATAGLMAIYAALT